MDSKQYLESNLEIDIGSLECHKSVTYYLNGPLPNSTENPNESK